MRTIGTKPGPRKCWQEAVFPALILAGLCAAGPSAEAQQPDLSRFTPAQAEIIRSVLSGPRSPMGGQVHGYVTAAGDGSAAVAVPFADAEVFLPTAAGEIQDKRLLCPADAEPPRWRAGAVAGLSDTGFGGVRYRVARRILWKIHAAVTGGCLRAAYCRQGRCLKLHAAVAGGETTIIASTLAAPLLHAAGDYFATPDGKAVYLAGNHTWTDGQNIGSTPFDFSAYLNLLQSEGANFIRLWHWESKIGGGTAPGNVGLLPYTQTADGKFDLTSFNQAYFDDLRSKVRAAGAKGMYVSLMLFNGFSVRANGSPVNPWLTNPLNAAENINGINGDPNNTGTGVDTQTLNIPSVWAIEQQYIAKVVQTVSDLPNVLFEVANETAGGDANFAWQNAVVDYIKQLEQSGGGLQHPVGITAFNWDNPPPGISAGDYVNSLLFQSHADWISPSAGSQYQSNPPDALGGKVVIADTDHIFGIGGNVNWVWQQFTRGNNVLSMDDLSGTGIAGTLPGFTPSAGQLAAEISDRFGIAETRQVATMVNLTGMTPSDALSSTGYALADPASGKYVVYAPNGGTFTVDLSGAAGKTLDIRWMNVGSGQLSAPTTMQGGSSQQNFSSPSGNSVLVLTPATLTVGHGSTFQFQSVAAAIAASASGDTIQIQAGNYVDDYAPTITHDLTIVGVGGQVQMIATAANPPPNKGILAIGAQGASPNVSVQNVTFRNTVISDSSGGNGAGIRYQGGNLTLIHDGFLNNQDGLLAASDPTGSITVNGCFFRHNGSGTGLTHNIDVNDVGTLTLEHSYFLDAVVGHEIKSRAENTIITNNVIADGATGTASYSVDLPNGGNAIIEHNVIEKGPNAQNPVIITTGEEGNIYASSSLTVSYNLILNDETAHSVTAVRNDTSETAQITGNKVWGLAPGQISSGPANVSGTVFLTTDPPRGPNFDPNVSAATLSAATRAAPLGFLGGQGSAGQPGYAASSGAATGGNGATVLDVAAGATVDASSAAPELFRITAGTGGSDQILNFRPGVNHLQLAGFGAGAEQAVLAGARDSSAGTAFTLTGGVQVTLAGVHGASARLFG